LGFAVPGFAVAIADRNAIAPDARTDPDPRNDPERDSP
jgi:hypothetical protein